MKEIRLGADGRIQLPAELRASLGWNDDIELMVQTDGDRLLLQPATETRTLKAEAMRIAGAMRNLAGAAQETLQRSQAQPEPQPPPPDAAGAPSKPELRSFRGISPHLAPGVYLAPGCVAAGDVTLEADVSVWPGAVIRGDVAPVSIGSRSNIQDGAVIHVAAQAPCRIGRGVTVGHQATLHACTIEDHCLIGIHAVVLDGAQIGEHCIVAAGALVPPGMVAPPRKMLMGVPARVVRDLEPAELEKIQRHADAYVSLKAEYCRPSPAAPDPPAPAAAARQAAPPAGALPRALVMRTTGAILPDGALDDAGWKGIAPLPLLVRSETGEPAVESTEVKLCYDDQALYVAFACKDSDVWSSFTERDAPLYDEEVVEIFLCPTGDLRHYWEIEISPANLIFDARVFNPEGDRRTMLVDREWDARGMQTGVRVAGRLNDRTTTDTGWIAEVRLPFSDLGLSGPPAPGAVWRANFYRIERGSVTEFSAWSPTLKTPADFHVPERFGEIEFQ